MFFNYTSSNTTTKKNTQKSKKNIIFGVGLLIILVGGLVAYMYNSGKKETTRSSINNVKAGYDDDNDSKDFYFHKDGDYSDIGGKDTYNHSKPEKEQDSYSSLGNDDSIRNRNYSGDEICNDLNCSFNKHQYFHHKPTCNKNYTQGQNNYGSFNPGGTTTIDF